MATNNPIPFGVLRGHTDSVNSVCFVNENCLASCAANGELKLWNVRTRRVEASILAHDRSIQSVAKVPLSNRIITGSRDGFSKLWDLNCPLWDSCIVFQNGMNHFCNVAVDHVKQDANLFVTATADESRIIIWDIRQPQTPINKLTPNEISGSTGMLTSLLYHSSSSFTSTDVSPKIFAGYENGSLQCFDLRNLQCINSFQSHKEPIFALDMSPVVSDSILSAGADTIINQLKYSYNKSTNKDNKNNADDENNIINCNIKKKINLSAPGIGCMSHREDGRIFVTANWDHTVRIYDSKRMKPLAYLRFHRDTVNTVAFSPIRNEEDVLQLDKSITSTTNKDISSSSSCCSNSSHGIFATGSKDNTIALWDVYSHTIKKSYSNNACSTELASELNTNINTNTNNGTSESSGDIITSVLE